MQKIRWGILSTGNIAEQFARGLAVLDDAELVAVGSRSQESADRFGDTFNVPHRHATYEDLASDPDVDVIYVGTPHPFHAENTLLCLRAGKAVLCEKPFAMNAAEAEAMIGEARARGLFLMEAMWTRFLPHIVKLRELLAQGAIGEVQMMTGNFGFRTEFDPKSRMFAPELGGGGLLDVGIYPISLASMLFGAPQSVVSQVRLGSTGVDEQAAAIFRYASGAMASVAFATRTELVSEAWIYGTTGRIHVRPPWWGPSTITLYQNGQPEQQIAPEQVGNGYNYEAAEVAACLRAGKLESDVISLDETLAIMRTMDTIRAEWGLRYPGE
ncbi:Gfo/Idh/MocA family oxidoreductase [Chloroflexia bacterium SDU3-3]|nr:Gfo/Idh/MocA family oxidoreductase [Chloroflexia bacterium SDU3-3]